MGLICAPPVHIRRVCSAGIPVRLNVRTAVNKYFELATNIVLSCKRAALGFWVDWPTRSRAIAVVVSRPRHQRFAAAQWRLLRRRPRGTRDAFVFPPERRQGCYFAEDRRER
eukprot:3475716-Pyramimonas_sp.AAC.2